MADDHTAPPPELSAQPRFGARSACVSRQARLAGRDGILVTNATESMRPPCRLGDRRRPGRPRASLVVAPAFEQSGVAHATHNQPHHYRPPGRARFAPRAAADCVLAAVSYAIAAPPYLCAVGLTGQQLCENVAYAGTVGARWRLRAGLPASRYRSSCSGTARWTTPSRRRGHAPALLRRLLTSAPGTGRAIPVLHVNFPPPLGMCGVRAAPHGRRRGRLRGRTYPRHGLRLIWVRAGARPPRPRARTWR